MWHSSKILLSEKAFKNNLNFLKKEFGKDVKISSVVKGNAYGHGIEPFVNIAEKQGVNHFSVFSADEAYRVKKTLTEKHPILIMGFIDQQELEWAIENDIEFFVFEKTRLKNTIRTAKKIGKKALIHIEIETGMNRTGFEEKELLEVIKILKREKNFLSYEGICTHFAGAESISNYVRIEKQKKRFIEAVELFKENGIEAKYIHSCCSAAAIRYPEMRSNLVRIGILLYGFWPSQEVKIDYMRKYDNYDKIIRRIINWESKIMSIKEVPMGEYIGYGTSYLASKNMRVAIIPIGYGNGFSRSFSNSGRVLIRNVRVPVVGMVNMSSIAVDITVIPDAQIGDDVVLIGTQGKLEITASSFGEMSEQLNYEVLTRLPESIPRIIKS